MTLLRYKISRDIHDLTNKQRVKHHLGKLSVDEALMKAALLHSRDMAKYNYCGHVNKKGRDTGYRLKKAGFDIASGESPDYGENCSRLPPGRNPGLGYVSETEHGIAHAAMRDWMRGAFNREKILNPEFTKTGVGTAFADGYYYLTQVFYR
jgi:uncharacterized protein YkwD